ncbi:DMT family transporter [bacterium]|nr:MAG: DMT family transporter [bacterium]
MIYVLIALFIGSLLAIQLGVNNALKVGLGTPLWAAFVSFFVGAAVLFLAGVVSHTPLPGKIEVPMWVWTGGLLGAVYVLLSIVIVDKLGAATLMGCVVTGQIIASLVIDHFGWLRIPQHALSPGRLLGALLLGLGVYLVKRF